MEKKEFRWGYSMLGNERNMVLIFTGGTTVVFDDDWGGIEPVRKGED